MNDSKPALLKLDQPLLRDQLDRKPFGFDHDLHRLPLFSPDALYKLAQKYAQFPEDYFVSGSAPTPGTRFYSLAPVAFKPHEAMERLDQSPVRILLKRMEKHDPDFRDLLHSLLAQVIDTLGGIGNDRVTRLESAIFISSAASITPFHYDPETNFFSQIEGEKIYHLYAPSVVTEPELESFYSRGVLDIAQLQLDSRDASQEYVFALRPGKGMHQPRNSPHWVETVDSRSISYVFVYETESAMRTGRVRAFNHYLRAVGMHPAGPLQRPMADAAKAAAMRVVLPLRRRLGRLARAFA
jgi:hypothetical protein